MTVPFLLAGHVAADAARHWQELVRLAPLQGSEIFVRSPYVHQARFGPDLHERSTSKPSGQARSQATADDRNIFSVNNQHLLIYSAGDGANWATGEKSL